MHGSKRICRYPCLIAAYHVLLRLLAPRHPSCALCSLINLLPRGCLRPREIVITETLFDWPDCSGRISDSTLKVVFTYLYVDVKEPAKPTGLRSVWTLEFLRLSKLKTVVVCLIRGPRLPNLPSPLPRWWAWQDSNLRPCAYQAHALTN